MKYKILKVEKRNWLMRWWSINHYVVTVSVEGKVISLKCWAGVNEPTKDSLISDIERQLRPFYFKTLEGLEREV